MGEVIDTVIFSVGKWALTPDKLFFVILVTIAGMIGNRVIRAKWRATLFQTNDIEAKERKIFDRYLRYALLLLLVYGYIKALQLDYIFYPTKVDIDQESGIVLKVSHIVIALLILVGARIADWVLNNVIVHKYYSKRDDPSANHPAPQIDAESIATKIVQSIVVILTALLIMKRFGLDFQLFEYTYEDKVISFRVTKILVAVLIIMIARLGVWLLTQIMLYGIYKRRGIDKGAQFAINQLIKYVIYVIAILIALHSLGINMTLIWGGAAALLVGIGLGLQQTFNDFFSGIVLLFERTVSVGDMVNVNGSIGKVMKIGLRASIIETRAAESVIVPNSKLVNDAIINWTHVSRNVRFQVDVGVAYGSDTDLVKKLLLRVANDHPHILDYPTPFVRFQNFGASSLDFSVFFFTKKYILVEDIRSDLRFEIDKAFRNEDISIPFPQRDLWIKTIPKASSEDS